MAEHRRVEPRGIVGTGMATDPERIREVEDEHERRARVWRAPPERGFGDVLAEAPPRGRLEDDADGGDERRRRRPSGQANAAAQADAGAPAQAGEGPTSPAPAAGTPPAKQATPPAAVAGQRGKPITSKPLPRVLPDPREILLRKQLDAPKPQARTPPTADTQPASKTRKPS